MKKNREKSMMMCVLVLGVLLIIVVYMFVYNSYKNKTAELKASNAVLQARADELKVFYDNRDTYEKGIKEFTADIKDKLSVFPGDAREEDALDLAIAPWEDGILVDYKQIGIGEAEEVGSIDADTVKTAAIDGYEDAITFHKRSAVYTNLTTYNDLKDIIKIFDAKGERLIISTISYVRDDTTGLLNGNIEGTFYYVTGINAPYTEPEFSEYLTGLTNVFAISANKDEEGNSQPFISNGQVTDVPSEEGNANTASEEDAEAAETESE